MGKTLRKITGREDKGVTMLKFRSTTCDKREGRKEGLDMSPRPLRVSARPVEGFLVLKVPIRGMPS